MTSIRKSGDLFFCVALIFFLGVFVSSDVSEARESTAYKSREFVCASSNNFPPMNLLDKEGHLMGFGRDLSTAVINAIEGKVTHIHSSHWTEVLGWMDSGKADFIHDTGYTKDREESFDYTDWIIEMPEAIFVRPEQYDITGFKSLKGKTVICVNKHITHLYLQQFPEINCHVVKTPVEGLYELVAGKGDAFIYPKQIILYLIQNLRLGDKTKITGEPLRTLTWGMVVKKGNRELLQLLNEGIAKVKKSGEYDRIYDKWWGKKILAGYSKRELQVFTAVITGISVVLVALAMLLFFNRRLSSRVDQRTAELGYANRKLSEAMNALWGEMELAKKIQTVLLPKKYETDNIHPDMEIAAAMLPAEKVGGDFYDITLDRSGTLWLAVGDVSGHGVTPGLIMMMAQTIHTTVTTNLDCDARDVVVKTNEILYRNVHERLKESHFMTFTALKYLGDGRFQHAGAHLSMIVFRQKTGACELVTTRGVYLNFKKNIAKATKNAEFSLDPGDVLILYTDGLTEAEDPDGKMLDLDGFVKIVEKHAHQEPEAMKDMIMADVIRWCDDTRADDMTLVIVKRKTEPAIC